MGYSSRAQITPTSFVNEYNWGDFKGDEDAWMEKYFDAFLYFANWGTRTVKFRLPARLLDPEISRAYCDGNSTSLRTKDDHLVLTFCSECEGGDDSDYLQGAGLLGSLIPVRAELARGDPRALYLGWLAFMRYGDLDDEAIEPPVPAGLGQLSGSLEAFADFLRVDSDLLEVAAQASPARPELAIQRDEIAAWVGALSPAGKDEILTRLLVDPDDPVPVAELQQRFLKARDAHRSEGASSAASRRTVGALLRAAEEKTAEREQAAARRAASEKARNARETAAARARHLDRLAGQESRLWADVDRLVGTKLPKSYDQAVNNLVDLRDLTARAGGDGGADFMARLEGFRATHARKPSLLERIARAGL